MSVHISIHDADEGQYLDLLEHNEEKINGSTRWCRFFIGSLELTVFRPDRTEE